MRGDEISYIRQLEKNTFRIHKFLRIASVDYMMCYEDNIYLRVGSLRFQRIASNKSSPPER